MKEGNIIFFQSRLFLFLSWIDETYNNTSTVTGTHTSKRVLKVDFVLRKKMQRKIKKREVRTPLIYVLKLRCARFNTF